MNKHRTVPTSQPPLLHRRYERLGSGALRANRITPQQTNPQSQHKEAQNRSAVKAQRWKLSYLLSYNI